MVLVGVKENMVVLGGVILNIFKISHLATWRLTFKPASVL